MLAAGLDLDKVIMGHSHGPTRERLHRAETVVSVACNQPHPLSRISGAVARRLFRIGRTSSTSSYPTDGNTFEVIFVNPSYTESDGDQSVSTSDRQASPIAWVRNLSDHYIPEGKLVACWLVGDQWYCEWPTQGQRLQLVISQENIAHNDDGYVRLAAGDPGG